MYKIKEDTKCIGIQKERWARARESEKEVELGGCVAMILIYSKHREEPCKLSPGCEAVRRTSLMTDKTR